MDQLYVINIRNINFIKLKKIDIPLQLMSQI